MTTAKLTYGMISSGLPIRQSESDPVKSKSFPFNLRLRGGNNICLANSYKKKLGNGDVLARWSLLSTHRESSFALQVTFQKKPNSSLFGSHFILNCGSNPSFVDESSTPKEQYLRNSSERASDLEDKFSSPLQKPDAKREVLMLSWPAFVGQAIEPFAQLMETAYIGRLGSVELASAGISISIFNIISKLFNIPLLSIATSFVAEDISKNESIHFNSDGLHEEGSNSKAYNDIIKKKHLSSVSTALVLAVGIGISEALALGLGSGLFLNLMGISKGSPMRSHAQKFLCLRALGSPAVVISLALHGIFRGFKDTKTPVLCLGIGNFSAIFLLPLLMYCLRLGVTGAALSIVISQYIVTLLMIWHLNKRVILLPPKLRDLRFSAYLKSGSFLIGRTLAVLITMTLGTSMAVRQGPVSMAAHQICLQVWLAVSLLTDALASSAQALVASYLSKGDYKTSREVTNFVLRLGLLTGVSLAVILGLSFSALATLFTKDMEVLAVVKTVVLFVSASQPLNSLAFIVDGLHYGVSDFKYAAYSMITVAAISSAYLLYAPSIFGFRGVWSGLALFMGLRAVAGCVRLLSKDGPWWFLHVDLKEI